VALHGVELEHKLKAAGIVHNWMLIVVRCRGRSAVIYLIKPKLNRTAAFGFKKIETEPSF